MNVLVTGATGFIGSRLVPALSDKGFNIRCLVRKTSDISKLKELKNVDFFYGDITDPETISGAAQNIDTVIHLAVLGHLKKGTEEEYTRVNVKGTINVIDESISSEVKKIIVTTTTAALGIIPGRTVTEEDEGIPLNEYGRSKAMEENAVKELIKTKAAPVLMLRFSHVYGPGEQRDLHKIIKMMKKGIFPQIGLKANLYPAVYIDDVVQSIIQAMEYGRTGETYIITDNKSHDLKDIRKIVNKELGKETTLYPVIPKFLALSMVYLLEKLFSLFGKDFSYSVKNINSITARRQFSIEKAKKELHFSPRVSLEEGLHRTIEYYKRNNLI